MIRQRLIAGALSTAPPVSQAASLALGAAYQNTLGYDVLLVVYLNITVNTTGVISLGVGPTSSPAQQTIVTGVTSLGFCPVAIYLPRGYYALLSTSGTITLTVAGQVALPV